MRRKLLGYAFLLASSAPLVAGAQNFTGLGFLVDEPDFDIGSSSASAISADGGTVVGTSDTWEGRGAFLWTRDGGMEEIGDMLGGFTDGSAAGVSADGTIVAGTGSYAVHAPDHSAFQWTAESGFQAMNESFDPYNSYASSISGDGSVIGGSAIDGPFFDRYSPFPIVWTRSGFFGFYSGDFLPRLENPADYVSDMGAALGVSADGSVVVGYAWSTAGHEAARWIGGGVAGLGDLAGGGWGSRATDVSANGERIVGQGTSGAGHEAFLWSIDNQQGMVSLGDLPGGPVESIANAISADGTTVVGDGTVGVDVVDETEVNVVHPFIWTQADGMRDLNDLAGRGANGWVLRSAAAVSGNGTVIAGTGTNPDGKNEAWVLDLLPEPDQALGALAAWCALASLRTFRRRPPWGA